MPSAHTYTGSRASSRRRFHVAYSACQPAFSRAIDGADSGAASPSSPRRARSKSPWASPCRYSSGRSRPTSSVRRLNSGSSRLSNRPSSPRSRGRRTVIVPVIVLSRRGLPNPFRYPGAASTPSRRAYRRRPTTCSTSSSKSCCSNRWTPCRANASRLSHVGLDSAPVPVLFSFMGGVSFGGRSQRPRFGLWSPEGYTAFSSFTHPLTLPPNAEVAKTSSRTPARRQRGLVSMCSASSWGSISWAKLEGHGRVEGYCPWQVFLLSAAEDIIARAAAYSSHKFHGGSIGQTPHGGAVDSL